MSPEQVQGDQKLDAASDVYSLGIILFEMLTGQQPFKADTPTRLMMKHVLEPVPRIRDLNPGLPEGADQVITRAMAKVQWERYSSAGELARAARELLGAERRGTAPPAKPIIELPAAAPARKRLVKTLLSASFSRPQFKTLAGLSSQRKTTIGLIAFAAISTPARNPAELSPASTGTS